MVLVIRFYNASIATEEYRENVTLSIEKKNRRGITVMRNLTIENSRTLLLFSIIFTTMLVYECND